MTVSDDLFVLECLDIAMYTTFREEQVFLLLLFVLMAKKQLTGFITVSVFWDLRFCTWRYASMTGHS